MSIPDHGEYDSVCPPLEELGRDIRAHPPREKRHYPTGVMAQAFKDAKVNNPKAPVVKRALRVMERREKRK